MKEAQGMWSNPHLVEWVRKYNIPIQQESLLMRALTHRSYINEHPEALEDNERLEFLGDAVLDFVVGAWLYHRFPEMAEGELTRMRSALVRTEQLAEFARQIQLGDMLNLGRGEESNGGRTRDGLLCGAFEALSGALFLDRGLGLVEEFMEVRLPAAVEKILAEGRAQDPKSVLQEWTQAQGLDTPFYRIQYERGPDHKKEFGIEVLVDDRVVGQGQGSSKREAAREAAAAAIQSLGIDFL